MSVSGVKVPSDRMRQRGALRSGFLRGLGFRF